MYFNSLVELKWINMLAPKIFYRKLDSILSRIGKEKSHKDFLFSILKEIENTFGDDLHIKNGRLYEKNGEEYDLVSAISENIEDGIAKSLLLESEPVIELLKYGTYIFDNTLLTIDRKLNGKANYSVPAAIVINNSLYSWIFIYELQSGWIREEIELCFNAVRSALNQRLFSDEMKNELTQAAMIQKSLLPQNPPQFEGYCILGKTLQADLVGGDLFDYYFINENTLGIAVGDASGHGLPAALLVRDVVTGMRMGFEDKDDMVNTFKKLNRVIYKSVYSTRFISLVYCELEKSGNINYINAGHPPPLLINKNRIKELASTGLIFGAIPEIELHKSSAKLEKGDFLVLFTDGVIEKTNRRGNEFGLKRLKELLYVNKEKSPQDLLNLVFDEISNFSKIIKQEDDITVVLVNRLG